MGTNYSDGITLGDALAALIIGDVFRPGDAGYDEVCAVWNGRFRRRPAIIARCVDAADVAACVRFARAHDVQLSVKGGGHAYAGNTVGEGGLLVDLGGMRTVEVDPDARRVTVGAGATWREVDEATQAHGLATVAATVSSVGIAGFTLGGGLGWLSRAHGLAADNLVGAEVVTAEGDIVRAAADENPDLFWGLRGGGGNFGVVSRLELTVHPVGPDVYAGQVFSPAERAPELLRFFGDHMKEAPDELMAFLFFLRIPPLDVFPAEYHGRLAVDLVVGWFGPIDRGEEVLAPFRAHGDAIVEFVGPQPYLALQQSFDAGMSEKGNRWFSRAHYLDELTNDAIETIVDGLDPMPGEFTTVYLSAEGGAVGRVPAEDTPFPHRSAAVSIHVFPGWTREADDDAVIAWTRTISDAIAPHANGGVYVNLLADDETERVVDAYGENFQRLRELKARWDPDNLFRMNHNIEPVG